MSEANIASILTSIYFIFLLYQNKKWRTFNISQQKLNERTKSRCCHICWLNRWSKVNLYCGKTHTNYRKPRYPRRNIITSRKLVGWVMVLEFYCDDKRRTIVRVMISPWCKSRATWLENVQTNSMFTIIQIETIQQKEKFFFCQQILFKKPSRMSQHSCLQCSSR